MFYLHAWRIAHGIAHHMCVQIIIDLSLPVILTRRPLCTTPRRPHPLHPRSMAFSPSLRITSLRCLFSLVVSTPVSCSRPAQSAFSYPLTTTSHISFRSSLLMAFAALPDFAGPPKAPCRSVASTSRQWREILAPVSPCLVERRWKAVCKVELYAVLESAERIASLVAVVILGDGEGAETAEL